MVEVILDLIVICAIAYAMLLRILLCRYTPISISIWCDEVGICPMVISSYVIHRWISIYPESSINILSDVQKVSLEGHICTLSSLSPAEWDLSWYLCQHLSEVEWGMVHSNSAGRKVVYFRWNHGIQTTMPSGHTKHQITPLVTTL